MLTIISVPPPSAAAVTPAIVARDLSWLVAWDLPVMLVVPPIIVMVLFVTIGRHGHGAAIHGGHLYLGALRCRGHDCLGPRGDGVPSDCHGRHGD